MDSNKVVLRASLQGMLSKLLKFILFTLVALTFWRRIRGFQQRIFNTYDVSYLSALTNAMETDIEIMEMVLLAGSYLAALAVLILLIYLFGKILSLLFALTGVTVIDFDQQRITEKRFVFPFQRIEDESMFHQIIQVRIDQTLLDRLAGGGNLYVEYLVLSKLDSQLRVLDLPFMKHPEKLKKKLI
ncbi:hypothetical protein [Anoxynatronum sibiricum]|uniref:DUF304 domain-containing protein n=1 Tax=Anoxynatronum sibiricum TaxID=210623 RepID=A0ABU9VVN6_9CLOT